MVTLSATIEERIQSVTEQRLREEVTHDAAGELPESTAPEPRSAAARFGERLARRFGHRELLKLSGRSSDVTRAWRELPDRIHRLARQAELIRELVDDFRSGAYRQVPWRSIAVGTAAVLYVVNPADLIPEALIGIGQLDDLAVIALALRVLRKDLRGYCEFKGYAVEDYFGPATPKAATAS